MNPRIQLLPLLLLVAPQSPLLAQEQTQKRGALLERVAEVLTKSYYDKDFRAQVPTIAERYATAAAGAETLNEERQVVHEFLSNLEVSHLGLMSTRGRDSMFAELTGRQSWMFGFQLVHLEEGWFVDWVYEGGPADRAGLERGDEVLTLDGLPPERSPRVDWRTDDCALPDPAMHGVLAEPGDSVNILLRRGPSKKGRLALEAEEYSGWEAAKKSVSIKELGPFRVGYVHYWFIPMSGGSSLLRDLCTDRFSDCDALVFDLRGRGGAGHEAMQIIEHLDASEGLWRKPLVLLIDDDTRSAKEVISYDLKQSGSALIVGEKTPGAVIPATFTDVGSDTFLMFPSFTLGRYTEEIEGVGVTPDIHVAYPLAWTAGADPVLEAGFIAAQAWCEELVTGNE